MSWINGYERKKFEAKMKKQAEEYRAVGMTEEQIQQIQEFDLAQFNSDRRYYEHTQEFPDSSFDDGDGDEGQSPLYKRFRELLTVSIEVYDDGSRYRDGKEAVIRKLMEYGKVAMVGDGINDAPALTRADMPT